MTPIAHFVENLEVNNNFATVDWFIRKHNLNQKDRRIEIKTLRQYIMYLLRKNQNLSFENIGKKFGKHHATVMHSVNVIENYLDQSDMFLSRLIDKYKHDIKAINWKL